MKKVISILVAMLLVMAAVAPAIASTPAMPADKPSANACNCAYCFDSLDSDTEREIIDIVSKELPVPETTSYLRSRMAADTCLVIELLKML